LRKFIKTRGLFENKDYVIVSDYDRVPFSNNPTYTIPELKNCPTEEEIKAAKKVLENVKKAKEKQRAKTKIKCGKCGSSHRIKDLDLVQTHWYTEPYGCTGGDYWSEGECQVICPDCNTRNRLNFNCKKLQSSDYTSLFRNVFSFYESSY
jgi:hypothetical protein